MAQYRSREVVEAVHSSVPREDWPKEFSRVWGATAPGRGFEWMVVHSNGAKSYLQDGNFERMYAKIGNWRRWWSR